MDLKQKLLAKKTPEEIEQERMDAMDPFRQPGYNPDAVDAPVEELQLEDPVPVESIGAIKARPVLTAEQAYQAQLSKQQSEIDALSAQRRQAEVQGEADLLASEENYRGNSLAKGLMGAGKSLSQTLGAINKADVTGAVTGFESGVAGLADSEKQNRAFIKDRLSRADQPFRSLTDSQIASQRAQTSAQVGVEAPMEIGKKRIESDLLTKKSSGSSDVSEASRKARALELRQAARTAIQNKDMATGKQLNALAQNIESGSLSNAELAMIEDLKVTREEDKSLEWFKALTQRQAVQSKDQPKEKQLSDKQVEAITGFDNIVNAIADIRATKPKIDTGKMASAQNFLAQKLGIDDAEVSTFKAKVGDQLSQYMKSISGSAISAQEADRLIANLPTLADNDETFMRKLNNFEQQIKDRRLNFLNNIDRQGKNAAPFLESSSTSAKSSGRVKVPSANDLPDL